MAGLNKKELGAGSVKRLRDMLCFHQVFRRVPEIIFNNPDGELWDRYAASVKAVYDDKDLNMDYQWEGNFTAKDKEIVGAGQYSIPVDALSGDVRPLNPRLEEAYHMITMRPSITDMEQDTVIFQNALKEYPAVSGRKAMYKACREIYTAIDRDLYFFTLAVDGHYGTDFTKNALAHILAAKREDKAYVSAEAYLDNIEQQGLVGARKQVLEQELSGYTAVIRMNRNTKGKKTRDGKPIAFKDYKGLDVSWAEGRIPSDISIRSHLAQALVKPLEEAVGQAYMKKDKLRRYEALLDRVDRARLPEKNNILLVHASDILYGFGYANVLEGKYEEKRSGLLYAREGKDEGISI